MAMSRSRRMQLVDAPAVDADLARGDRLQPGDGVEQRRLAAAGRADEDEEAALLDREVDALQHVDGAEALLEIVDFEERHALSPSPRRPSGRARNSGPATT